MRRVAVVLIILTLAGFASLMFSKEARTDPRLAGAFRKPAKNGWTFVHLQGTPSQMGFQHGYLLAPEIEDALKVTVLEQTHDSKKDWQFFRDAAQNMMWPHIEEEYRQELQGITDGASAHGNQAPV